MDRNRALEPTAKRLALSLSARRAWIEIWLKLVKTDTGKVALRKESVDRNRLIYSLLVSLIWSLSARRAWIEMTQCRL